LRKTGLAAGEGGFLAGRGGLEVGGSDEGIAGFGIAERLVDRAAIALESGSLFGLGALYFSGDAAEVQ
jgi:hypothetical protein